MKLMILDEARPKIMNRSGWSWLNLTDWTDSVPVPEERYLSFIEKRKLKNKNANGESNQINNRSARGFLRKSRRSSRNSSVGRALDWRSKGPWFDPGFRQWFCAVCTLGKGFQCCHYLLLIITYDYLRLLTISPPVVGIRLYWVTHDNLQLVLWQKTQSVGFEPTLPKGIWFLVRRLNHSATTASISMKHTPAPPLRIVTKSAWTSRNSSK